MDSSLTLSALQTDLFWEDKSKNLHQLAKQIEALPPTDVILLPEMFTTGFTMAAQKLAEDMEGETVQWMRHWAEKKQAAIGGSTIIKEAAKVYNRFLWVHPSGEIDYYDKRHTFTLAGESDAYATGQNDGIIHYKDWKICLRVCYDVRFPVWNRNKYDYNLLIFTANWPAKRIAHWDALLKARAIENMTYCIGVNRIGTDGANLHYPGHTAFYDYMGETLSIAEPNRPQALTTQLNKASLQQVRQKLPFLNDRDRFTIQS